MRFKRNWVRNILFGVMVFCRLGYRKIENEVIDVKKKMLKRFLRGLIVFEFNEIYDRFVYLLFFFVVLWEFFGVFVIYCFCYCCFFLGCLMVFGFLLVDLRELLIYFVC